MSFCSGCSAAGSKCAPQQNNHTPRTRSQKKRPPRSPGRARSNNIKRACPGSGGIHWGVGRPAGGPVFFFAAGARRVFCFCCGCAASLHHPLHKEIQGPRCVFCFAAGARAHSFARCLPPGAPTANNTRSKKKAPRTAAAKIKTHRAHAAKRHPQQ